MSFSEYFQSTSEYFQYFLGRFDVFFKRLSVVVKKQYFKGCLLPSFEDTTYFCSKIFLQRQKVMDTKPYPRSFNNQETLQKPSKTKTKKKSQNPKQKHFQTPNLEKPQKKTEKTEELKKKMKNK